MQEVKQFTDEVAANDGRWQDEHIEGFVVRAALKPGSMDAQPKPNDFTEANMHDPHKAFMWKIKFDQPYLMWREWREMTKRILAAKRKAGHDVAALGKRKVNASTSTMPDTSAALSQSQAASSHKSAAVIAEAPENEEEAPVPSEVAVTGQKSKKGKPASDSNESIVNLNKIRNSETKTYVEWVQKYMNTHPEAFVDYMDNRGIVAVRNAYLEHKAQASRDNDVPAATDSDKQEQSVIPETFDRTLIVPIAVPGCGKLAYPSEHVMQSLTAS